MSIDIRQFHQTFFDESLESLSVMESHLLRLERRLARKRKPKSATADQETLTIIFRIIHSIKGGGGTFGFSVIADLAHTLETLLDDLRAGRRAIDLSIVGLLLRSVDGLRSLLEAARTGGPLDVEAVGKLTEELSVLIQVDEARQSQTNTPMSSIPEEKSVNGWRIVFRPTKELFKTGNDPLRIVPELSTLGPIEIHIDDSQLPEWEQFDPEACYLGWEIRLVCDAPKSAIEEIFSWVTDECELTITPLNPDNSYPQASGVPVAGKAPSSHMHTEVSSGHTTSIRVSTPKVDALVDIVGELVITQTMLRKIANQFNEDSLTELCTGLTELERNMRSLQESVMSKKCIEVETYGFIVPPLANPLEPIPNHRPHGIRYGRTYAAYGFHV